MLSCTVNTPSKQFKARGLLHTWDLAGCRSDHESRQEQAHSQTTSELADVQKQHQAEASTLQEQLSVHQEAVGIHHPPPPPAPLPPLLSQLIFHIFSPWQAFWACQGCTVESEAHACLHCVTDEASPVRAR